ncbi:MAG: fructose-bisphosphatase class II, partial [Pseudomonadota bacterium]|nr:fructose-bisphosphatase class II [Pseudomonadota bacterium]
ISLISDGDVAGVINTTNADTGIDLYVGQGGAPEGVLAAAALKCVGGQMQGRLVFRNEDEKGRARRVGIEEFDRKYALSELASSETVFCATGVTKGGLVDGVITQAGVTITDTLVMSSADGMVRKITSRHRTG